MRTWVMVKRKTGAFGRLHALGRNDQYACQMARRPKDEVHNGALRRWGMSWRCKRCTVITGDTKQPVEITITTPDFHRGGVL